jgi:hypothetical protein
MAGRPSKQNGIDVAKVEKMAASGFTNDQLAVALDVNVRTVYDWCDEHSEYFWPEFSQAIKRGKPIVDDKVERSLFERACGYEHPDVHISNFQGDITVTPTVKKYPPETLAAIFWLKNRRPKKWRDKHEVEHSGSISIADRMREARERAKAS